HPSVELDVLQQIEARRFSEELEIVDRNPAFVRLPLLAPRRKRHPHRERGNGCRTAQRDPSAAPCVRRRGAQLIEGGMPRPSETRARSAVQILDALLEERSSTGFEFGAFAFGIVAHDVLTFASSGAPGATASSSARRVWTARE